MIVSTLRVHYSNQFEKAAPDENTLNALKAAYASKLSGLTPKDVLRGLNRATNSKFMPNPWEFAEACRATVEDLKMPSEEDAYEEFLRVFNRPSGFRNWGLVHPGVYWCYLQNSSFDWNHMTQEKLSARFKALYRKAIQFKRDGNEFPVYVKQVNQQPSPRNPQREKVANSSAMSDIHLMLNGKDLE
jgi:hypothetical protein